MNESALSLETLSLAELLLRISIALIFGLILGFDRGSKNKPVDFRVYMIVGITTCLTAIMGQEIYYNYNGESDILQFDLARIIQGVLVGTGFLGAGAIIKQGDHEVIGTATGASIWSAGIFGLVTGFGLYLLSLVGFVTLALILIGFGYLRKPIFHEKENYDTSADE